MPALKYDVVALKSARKVIPSSRNKRVFPLEVLDDMIGCSLNIQVSCALSLYAGVDGEEPDESTASLPPLLMVVESDNIVQRSIPFALLSFPQVALLSV